MARRLRLLAWIAAFSALAAIAPAGPLSISAAQAGEPLSTIAPFAFPLLEGPQAKVEVGTTAPAGNASSFIGNQPAFVNFSVWWWDTGPATTARLVLDGISLPMAAAPTGDSDDTNGTLYQLKVNGSGLSVGDHAWHFNFQGPSGAARLPATGDYGQLRLDRADRFTSEALNLSVRQVASQRQSGGLATLREVVNRTMFLLNTSMGTDWDGATGYNYSDPNRFIIQPSGATYDNKEAYVGPTGVTRARYSDVATHSPNSQPAIKQALVLRGALLATGIFNDSDIVVWMEAMLVNGVLYGHPFLRIALHDLSEAPGDGPVDGDQQMDADIWGYGLPSPVPVGSHFGEDFDVSDDALFDGRVGWPQVVDPYSIYVIAPYASSINATSPDGTVTTFYKYDSRPNAAITNPQFFGTSWTDEPVVFDGLSSWHSAGLDLSYDWAIENTVWSGLGPIWIQPVQAVGLYTVTLNVRDAFGQVDSVTISFYLHGKTTLRNPIPDQDFVEDGRRQLNLQAYFYDEDGFSTMNFQFSTTPSNKLSVTRVPSSSPNINLTAAPDWCGVGAAQVNVTDGSSPGLQVAFNVTVTCVNDPPSVTSVPEWINFTEDQVFVLDNVGARATDVDGPSLTWTFGNSLLVTGTYVAGNDSFLFSAPLDRSGSDRGDLCVSDGGTPVCQKVNFTVAPANDPPQSLAPLPSQATVEDGPERSFLLADYFKDPDGDPLSVVVTAGLGLSAGYLDTLRQVWFLPLANFSGTTSFSLRVCDPSPLCLNTTVVVTVAPVNDAPTILTATPTGYATGMEGDRLPFHVTAADPDSPTLTYTFWIDGVAQGAAFQGDFEWLTNFSSAGRHDVNLTVDDGAGGQSVYHWLVQVNDRNRAPAVTISSAGGTEFKTGALIHLAVDGADPDGDPVNYTWSFGGVLQTMYGPEVDFRLTSEGNVTVRLAATDGRATTSVTLALKIVYEAPVEPPKNNTSQPPTTTASGFLPGPSAAAALGAMAAVAGIAAAKAARRRR